MNMKSLTWWIKISGIYLCQWVKWATWSAGSSRGRVCRQRGGCHARESAPAPPPPPRSSPNHPQGSSAARWWPLWARGTAPAQSTAALWTHDGGGGDGCWARSALRSPPQSPCWASWPPSRNATVAAAPPTGPRGSATIRPRPRRRRSWLRRSPRLRLRTHPFALFMQLAGLI